MTNKKLLKNLLATASTVAVLASGVSAAANNFVATAGQANTSTGANLNTAGAAAPANTALVAGAHTYFVNNQNLILQSANHGVALQTVNLWGTQTAGNKFVGLNVNGLQIALTNVTAGTQAAQQLLVDAAQGGGAGAIAPGASLGATAQTILSFGNAANAATLVSGLEYVAAVDGNNQANATLTVGVMASGAGNNIGTFTGTQFRSTAAPNGSNVVFAQSATISNGSLGAATMAGMSVNDGVTLTLSDGTNFATNAMANGLIVNGAGILNVQDANTKSGNIKIAAGGTVNVAANALAGIVTVTDNGTVNVAANATTGNVVLTTANSALNINGGTLGNVVTAGVDKMGKVTVAGDATVTQLGAAGATINSVNFTADSTLTINAGANAAGFVASITTTGENTGKLNITGKDLTVGTVGTADNALNSITFGSNNTLTVTGTQFNANVTGFGAGAAANRGTVAFQGAVTVNGQLGQGSNLSVVELNGANANVVFGDSLVNVETLRFTNAAAKASLTSVGTATMAVEGAGGGGAEGVLTISNNKNDVTLASIGAGNAVLTVNLDGQKNVTIAQAGVVQLTNLNFTANAAGSTFTVDSLSQITNITTASATKGGTVVIVGAASQLLNNFGATTANQMTELRYAPRVAGTACALDINNKQTFGAAVTATEADVLTVANAGAGAATAYGSFGTEGARLKSLAFVGGNTATVAGKTFSKAVTIANATAVVFQADVNGVNDKATGIALAGTGKAQFADNASAVNMPITGANSGLVVFDGSTTTGNIGTSTAGQNVTSVTFSGDKTKTVNLAGDIYAEDVAGSISLGAATFNVTKDQTFRGQVAIDGSVINLGTKVLTLEGPAGAANPAGKLAGNVTLNVDYNKVGQTQTVGKIVGQDNLVAVAGSTISLNVKGLGSASDVVPAYFTFVGAGTNAKNIVVNKANTNLFTTWTVVQGKDAAGTLLADSADLVGSRNTAGVSSFTKDITSNSSELVNSLFAEFDAGKLSGSALNVLNLLSELTVTDVAKAKEATERTAASPDTTSAGHALVGQVNSSIGTRIAQTASPAGIAGGEEAGLGLGVWVSGFGGMSTQKAKNANPGYKGTVFGGTVGVDAQVTENTSLGLALTYAGSTLKYKSTKAGDKATSTNMFVNIYGRQVIADDWFVQGNAGFGTGSVKAADKRVTLTGYDKANYKYDTMAISLEALAGYNYNVADGVALTPAVGLRYVNINEGGYTEKDSATSRTITKKSSDKLTGILGAAVASSYDMSGTTIAPEVHAFLEYDFKSKAPKVTAKIDGLSKAFDVSSGKQTKFSANLGTSLTARTDMFEYGIGYDAKLATRYQAHQGTLKLKVSL